MQPDRTYEYPVNERHSTVLGYTVTSQHGQHLWNELDWRGVRVDGGRHILNPCGGVYLHVRVKYDADQDGPQPALLKHRRQYRVRCTHAVGWPWRGGTVTDVKVKKRARKWFWLVTVTKGVTNAN